MDRGLCPHCDTELIFDETDNTLGVVGCPSCKNFFLLEEVEEDTPRGELLRIYTHREYNQDGTVRARSGYKARITSPLLGRTENVTANTAPQLFYKIRKKAEWLREKEDEKKNLTKAKKKTKSAEEQLKELENILSSKATFKWEEEKQVDEYPVEKPDFTSEKPLKIDALPSFNILESLLKGYKERREEKRRVYFEDQLKVWNKKKGEYEEELKEWEKRKGDFEKKKERFNEQIDKKIEKQKENDEEVVIEYFRKVLEKSDMPENFPNKFDIGYKPEEKMLIVEYVLPEYEDMPENKGMKYIKSRNATEPIKISKTDRERLYNNVLYSIPLRRLKEIFKNDRYDNVESVVFNGWVDTVDKATGNEKTICILTVHAKKEDFKSINLKKVDPKECFKGLKGVGSSKLSSLAPVAPILEMDKEDRRFIEGETVLSGVDEGVNIAAMDWEDFEHLVREVFEQQFAKSGMEVKVTQSSRDLGVDAVAFDPDPFRGGKIIIQAKRYSNTVKVESVRALYGIMQDEGAMKGILVTTSDYGPDAYKFAQGKPITLINGNNLLSMLEEYGHKAKIDLKEAKKILKGRTR
jgi:restriction system protein